MNSNVANHKFPAGVEKEKITAGQVFFFLKRENDCQLVRTRSPVTPNRVTPPPTPSNWQLGKGHKNKRPPAPGVCVTSGGSLWHWWMSRPSTIDCHYNIIFLVFPPHHFFLGSKAQTVVTDKTKKKKWRRIRLLKLGVVAVAVVVVCVSLKNSRFLGVRLLTEPAALILFVCLLSQHPSFSRKKEENPKLCVLLLVGLAYVGEDVVATALSLVASRVVYISKNKDGA